MNKKIDFYQVKTAHSKKWKDSDQTSHYNAAREFYRELDAPIDKYVYIHVKHLYDNSIEKFCFYKEIKERSYCVR